MRKSVRSSPKQRSRSRPTLDLVSRDSLGRLVLCPRTCGAAGVVRNDDAQCRATPSPGDARRRRRGRETLRMLVANGFPAELLADLVRDGLAMMQGETVKVDERTSEIIRVMITDAGQSAIEGRTP